MSEKKSYRLTERAGPWVAGKRRPASGRIELTVRQAAYELRLGNIVAESEEVAPAEKPTRAKGKGRG